MAKTVGIGIQSFETIRERDCFYVDKTPFIKEWWESADDVTLITRPRRFGKTLNMSMVEQFFSVKYAGRGELFDGLSIWQEEKYRRLQGTYPVIALSFASIKERDYETTVYRVCQILGKLYEQNAFLTSGNLLSDAEKEYYGQMAARMDEKNAPFALYQLSDYLCRYYGKKVIILLDEYDTPMQESYVGGFWDDMVVFTRSLFNATFKTNPHLERGLMTGITRVSKESIFSDLNHLKVVTTTADEYATAFGSTEAEVFAALEECGLGEEKEGVKSWYDGFTFGTHQDIYNPWSILNFLDTRKYGAYWTNTSSNRLVGKLIREGSREIKMAFEALLRGEAIRCPIDEQIVYSQLDYDEGSIWSLLLASGYLKVLSYEREELVGYGAEVLYDLSLTNYETERMFRNMVRGWFRPTKGNYNGFVKALLCHDVKAMNFYMNRVALQTFSYFDTGKRPWGHEPERFYHGFVLGLLVELEPEYEVTSNRESGFGRYDVMLVPKTLGDGSCPKPALREGMPQKDAIIMEFKVHDAEDEKDLSDTVRVALEQIREKQYEAALIAKGIPSERVRKYGVAFEGKRVLIGEGSF